MYDNQPRKAKSFLLHCHPSLSQWVLLTHNIFVIAHVNNLVEPFLVIY